MGFDPGREVQEKYGKCTKINDPANSVWRGEVRGVPREHDAVEDAKKAATLQGGIDHAAVG